MDEGEIFLDDGVERDDRRLDVVAVEQVSVAAHVPARVHQLLHLVEQALVLRWQFLPEEKFNWKMYSTVFHKWAQQGNFYFLTKM